MKKCKISSLVIFLLLFFLAPLAAIGDEVPFVPTPQAVVDEMLALGEVNASDNLIDLGSGDGRIVITAAKRYRAKATGIEYNHDLVLKSRENAIKEGVADKVKFLHEDLFLTDLSGATIITMYLLPEVNLKLRSRILSELAPGTRIVSHDFDMDDWEPDDQRRIKLPEKTFSYDGYSQIFLWIIPGRVDGRWVGEISGPDGDQPIVLEFNQIFQKASVKGGLPGVKLTGSCQLLGNALSLHLEPSPKKPKATSLQFNLRIQENKMEGTGRDGKRRPFTLRAKRSLN